MKEYRLISKEEPSDEVLHELMSQVAESARRSTENSNCVHAENAGYDSLIYVVRDEGTDSDSK